MYATDSASMLNKALRLIQAAERHLTEKKTTEPPSNEATRLEKRGAYRWMGTYGKLLGMPSSDGASGIKLSEKSKDMLRKMTS